eukprot:1926836-Pleurochrysis_carterae.AAC.1
MLRSLTRFDRAATSCVVPHAGPTKLSQHRDPIPLHGRAVALAASATNNIATKNAAAATAAAAASPAGVAPLIAFAPSPS